jgi:chromodomain-helicase-DNA-binding protein 4
LVRSQPTLFAEELKAADQLERFDPTSSDVRPRDRPPEVPAPPDRVRRSSRRRERSYSSVASNEGTEDSEDDSEVDSDTIPRRITRADAKRPQLSPRKTRSRTTRVPTYKESLSSDSEDINEDQPVIIRIKRTRKVHRIRPELGSIRYIDEAFVDLDTDDAALYKHYDRCMKCEELPAHFQLDKRRKNKGKKRATSEFEMTEEERLERQGGWVTCLRCCVASHWGCLSAHSRDEINRAFPVKGTTKANPEDSDRDNSPRVKRKFLGAYETTSYVCSACSLPNICTTCKEDVSAVPNQTVHETADANKATTSPSPLPSKPSSTVKLEPSGARTPAPLLFRCSTCARPTHYHHLPPLQEDEDQERPSNEVADEYQEYGWNCKDCHSWSSPVDRIIAWRPYPPNATEDSLDPGQVPSVKKTLPREYLVKWVDRSFR